MKCRHGLCMTEAGDNGYCDPHGGLSRQEDEWARNLARQERRVEMQMFVPKGQAVAARAGLSRFTPTTSAPAGKLSRAEREARRDARRATLLEMQPKKGSSSKIEGKKGKKSGKRAR